ncbi:MAG: DNA cytosine methyltransferase [archaeon]
MSNKLNAVSLFSGLGGLDLGLTAAGYKVIVHIDNDPYCVDSLKKNWKRTPVISEDIVSISGKDILKATKLSKKDIDLIAGGPSCQPFSRSNEGKRKGTKDARGLMIFEFARIVKELRPKAFIMENVAGLMSSNKGKDFKKLMTHFKSKLKYHVHYKVLNAADYGVAQKRKRLFIVGFRKKTDFEFPVPTHGTVDTPYVAVRDVIGDLDDKIVHDAAIGIGGKYGHLINDVPPGKNYIFFTQEAKYPTPLFKDRSKFWTFLLKLHPEEPSTTIQAQPWNSVGPFHWNNRRLSLSEIKRIQGIPDNYYIAGERGKGSEYGSPAWMQVGNAVPPKLGEVVSGSVSAHIK